MIPPDMKKSVIVPMLLALVLMLSRAGAHSPYCRSGYMGQYPCCRLPVPLPCCYLSDCRRPLGNIYYDPNGLAGRAQILLARMHYYDGEIDGDIGPRTRRAIRRYQIVNGLAVTGTVDFPLLRSMGLIR